MSRVKGAKVHSTLK